MNDLRRAAKQMRADWPIDDRPVTKAGQRGQRFHNATADWLEHIAKFVDNRPADVGPATAERVWANAYHVARAYLGES